MPRRREFLCRSCCPVAGKQTLSTTSEELIRPLGTAPVPLSAADHITMNASEMWWATNTGVGLNGFTARAFVLPHADPSHLKTSLAAVLEHYLPLAGRLTASGIALTNQGVAFTVAQSEEPCAPELPDPSSLVRFCDYHKRDPVAAGEDSIVSVKLTIFKDGSGVLGVGTSHSVLDGASAWAFVLDWARVARGESPIGASWDRSCLQRFVLEEETFRRAFRERFGTELTRRPFLGFFLKHLLVPITQRSFLRGSPLVRCWPVDFSQEELALLKVAANPTSDTHPGGSWVTTQEAIAAHVALTVARAVLPPSSSGNVAIVFVFDVRALVGIDAELRLGCGFLDCPCYVTNIRERTLKDIAASIHEQVQVHKKKAADSYSLFISGYHHGIGLETLLKSRSPNPADLEITLNNQSKFGLPDFGLASGGPARRVFSEVPAILAKQGGVVMNLLTVPPVKQRQRPAVIEALKQIPQDFS